MTSDLDAARAALGAAADLHRRVGDEGAGPIVAAAEALRAAFGRGRRVMAFGNGGSATDAAHFVAELVGRFRRERPGVPALALTSDPAVLTAVANDYGFDAVFARQVEAHGQDGDVAVAITTSGRSANVHAGLLAAKARGMTTIALTGRDGGATGAAADVHVNVPSDETARIQEVHRTILHIWCELIDDGLATGQAARDHRA